MIRILHTSDWHLGQTLATKKRLPEQVSFLDWLAQTLEEQKIEVLLVAGDIFDSGTPGASAQGAYYRFLAAVAAKAKRGGCCRHIVIVAGNHDSPSLLDAPRDLLGHLSVQVVGEARRDPADEILVLRDPQGEPELIIAAVPFLRDRDVRNSEAGTDPEEKERQTMEGIRRHYRAALDAALAKREETHAACPIIGLGHLYTEGASTFQEDGTRPLYVGTLGRLDGALFPEEFEYLALGHLHLAQPVRGSPRAWYSGAPIPLGFGEARREKRVLRVDLENGGREPVVHELTVPRFQELVRLKGDWPTIEQGLAELKKSHPSTGPRLWLEIVLTGGTPRPDFRKKVDDLVKDTPLEPLAYRVENTESLVRDEGTEGAELTAMNPREVFEELLRFHPDLDQASTNELLATFDEAIQALQDRDPNADE